MKILNINRFHYLRGGADLYSFLLADILRKKGHTVITFSTILDKNIPSDYSGYFVDGYSEETFGSLGIIKKAKIFLNGIYSLEAKRKLKQLIRKEKPDIAHIHGIFYQLSLSVLDALKEEGVPVIMTVHDYFLFCANGYLYRDGHICELCKSGRPAAILLHKCYQGSLPASLMAYLVKKIQHGRKSLDLVDRFLVHTEGLKKIMVDWGIGKDKIGLIHNPFDANQYEPSYVFDDYIVFYGRMARQKGIFTLLKAMGLLKDIKLKMFGSGPDLQEARRYIEENSLKNVEIYPHMPWGEKLIKIISKARFIVSCAEWFEPSGYVNYEAFALGKPVVASFIGGYNYLIRDGYNGLFFKPGDAGSLADKIKSLYADKNLILEMGRNARDFVQNDLSYDNFYNSLMNIYRDVLQKR